MGPQQTLQPQSLRSLINSRQDRACSDQIGNRPIAYLPIKAVDFVHPSAFMVASGKVYMLWEHDLVGKQSQNDFCRPGPSVHKVT